MTLNFVISAYANLTGIDKSTESTVIKQFYFQQLTFPELLIAEKYTQKLAGQRSRYNGSHELQHSPVVAVITIY